MTALPIENPHARRRRRGRAKPMSPARGAAPSRTAQHGRVPAASPAGGMSAVATLNVTFAELGVPAPLVAVLADAGITVPFPIQAAALPDALAGMDVLGRGRTGSGKTLGFAIPLAARLADGSYQRRPPPRPGPGAHPGAGQPGPRGDPAAGPGHGPDRRHDLRRHRAECPGSGTASAGWTSWWPALGG